MALKRICDNCEYKALVEKDIWCARFPEWKKFEDGGKHSCGEFKCSSEIISVREKDEELPT